MGGNTGLGEDGADGRGGVVVDVNLEALDGLGGVETLGADLGAVHDGVALVNLELVVRQELDTLITDSIARIVDPTEGLKQNSGSEVLLLGSPPVGGAGSGAASAQNALVQTVQILTLLLCLHHLLTVNQMVHAGLEPGADGLVLGIKVAHIGNQIADDRHVRQRINADLSVLIYTSTTARKGREGQRWGRWEDGDGVMLSNREFEGG